MLNPLLFPRRFLSSWPFSLFLYFFPLSLSLSLSCFFLFLFVVAAICRGEAASAAARALDAPSRYDLLRDRSAPSSSGSNKIKKPVTVTPVESSRLREACFALPCLDRVVPFRRRRREKSGTCYRRCNMFSCISSSRGFCRIVMEARLGSRHLSWLGFLLTIGLSTVKVNFFVSIKSDRKPAFENIFIFTDSLVSHEMNYSCLT